MLKNYFPRIFIASIFGLCVSYFFLCLHVRSPEKPWMEDQASNAILTNIFTETEYNVPDDFRMFINVIPYYDEEAETVTIFSLIKQEILSEKSVITEKKPAFHQVRNYKIDG